VVTTSRQTRMHRAIPLGIALLGASTAAGCSARGADEGRAATIRSPIAFGTLDTTHSAVVAVLSLAVGGDFEECTGSLVAVTGGNGYVLTAAHCCNSGFPPAVVVASSDYSAGEAFLSGGTPTPPAFAVVPGSIYADAAYDQEGGHDFCMLKFAGAGSPMATLALPASASDGLALGKAIEHVGFGITETTTNNTQRRTGTGTLDQELTPTFLEFSQGGASRVPGTCEGDSGGPTLLPAGVSQSQQVITGVQSFGNATSCAQNTIGVASRVSSAIGSGQFITSYLAGAPIGVRIGGSAPPAPAGSLWTQVLLAAALTTAGWAGGSRRRRVG
jgi:Trypsin